MASAFTSDDMMDVVNRTARFLSLPEVERRELEERLELWLAGDDEQLEESIPFEGDDEMDADYVPMLDDGASDAETDVSIETESLYDDDEELEDFYEGAAAIPEGDEEPSSSISVTSYKSKDDKIWSSVPPATGRPRAHNCPIVCREGPITGTMVNKYSGSGRTVYADNFFSSYDLATILMTKRLSYVGTIRKNKACIPKEMLDPKREVLSTLFGYHNNNVALCSYVPKKKKAVVLISTEHYTSAVDSSKPGAKPYQILDYNAYKTGVDTMDQMLGGYTCKRGTNRWPLAMFFNMLDVAGLAAFIIHDKLCHEKRNDRRRMFLTELAEQLAIPHMEERATNPILRGMQHVKQSMTLFGVEVPAGPPIDDQPAHAASSARRPSCALCFKMDKKTAKNALSLHALQKASMSATFTCQVLLH